MGGDGMGVGGVMAAVLGGDHGMFGGQTRSMVRRTGSLFIPKQYPIIVG